MHKGLRVVLYGIAGFMGVAFLLFVWGFGIEPRFLLDEHDEVVQIPGLPIAWEGQKVALIADMKVGLWMDNTRAARKAVKRIIDTKPALVLVSGDFVHPAPRDPKHDILLARSLLRPLSESGLPVVAVLGNSDYAMKSPVDRPDTRRAGAIREAMESIGISVLENDVIAITRDYPSGLDIPVPPDPLYIIGIGPRWPRRDRVDLALTKIPADAPRIVLMHHPDSFAGFPARTAPLALAGHTHGGQVRIPLAPEWACMSYYPDEQVHIAGWIPHFGKSENRLYVNRGIGCRIAPIRFNCPPELTVFTLERTPDTGDHHLFPPPEPIMDDVWIKVELVQ